MSIRFTAPSLSKCLAESISSLRCQQRCQSSLATAISVAREIFNHKHDPNSPVSFDPFRAVANELRFLTKNIRALLGSGHPHLDKAAKYYTQSEGKYIRPTLVLLMSQATSLAPKTHRSCSSPSYYGVNCPIAPLDLLNDQNPGALSAQTPASAPTGPDAEYSSSTLSSSSSESCSILPSQRRLAEIIELIHTASLLHDDVLDMSHTRRSQPSANIAFGNKLAVLAGDFMLGRASVALARLRDPEVTELIATVIANLVEGEFMQLRNTANDDENGIFGPRAASYSPEVLTYYLQKTYLKSASLISKSCRAAALLGQCVPSVADAAYVYGKNLGLAFQLVDDMLDYTISSSALGKPAGADLQLGLATAPLLFAWRQNSELGELVGRRFAQDGDVELARELVMQSDGLEQTRVLAQSYVKQAIGAISEFPESEAKKSLIEMCHTVLKRRK